MSAGIRFRFLEIDGLPTVGRLSAWRLSDGGLPFKMEAAATPIGWEMSLEDASRLGARAAILESCYRRAAERGTHVKAGAWGYVRRVRREQDAARVPASGAMCFQIEVVESSCLELQFTDLPSVRLDYEQSYGLVSGLLLFRREVSTMRPPPSLAAPVLGTLDSTANLHRDLDKRLG